MRTNHVIALAIGTLFVALPVAGIVHASSPMSTSVASADNSRLHGDLFGLASLGQEKSFEYPLLVGSLADEIAATGHASVRLTDSKSVDLSLTQFEMFLPGQKEVIVRGADDSIVSTTPLVGTTFRGSVIGQDGSSAFLLVTPAGLYGVIGTTEATYSLQPHGTSVTDAITQQVTWWEQPLHMSAPPAATNLLFGGLQPQTTYYLDVKPWAEPAYQSYASDFSNRIWSAYGYVQSMWQTETSITLRLYSVEVTPYNWGGIVNCGNGGALVSDSGITNFIGGWVHTHMFVGAIAYALFHAVDGQQSVMGCSRVHCDPAAIYGCLSDYPHSINEERATSAIQAKDWSTGDTYDPDETAHLGISVGHELTHNAGEDTHPTDSSGFCNYNIMYTNNMGGGVWCTNAWRSSNSGSTIPKVKTYAYPKLKTS